MESVQHFDICKIIEFKPTAHAQLVSAPLPRSTARDSNISVYKMECIHGHCGSNVSVYKM